MKELLLGGYTLIAVPQLDRAPRLEKDTFSGGYYVEARARNTKRLADWNSLYVKHDTRQIFGRTAMIDKLISSAPGEKAP